MVAVVATSTVASATCNSAIRQPGNAISCPITRNVPSTRDRLTYPITIAQSSAPAPYSAAIGKCCPKKGTECGSRNRMIPPSTMPPSPKVRLQNATVLPICSGVRPQWAYSR